MTRENLSSLLRYAAVALAFYAMGGGKGCDAPVIPWPVPPAPAPVYSAKVQAVVDAIKSNPTKAHKLATFYADFAKTAPSLNTVGDFAAAHKKGLQALAANDPPMVGAEIDAALAEIIGLVQDDPLAPKKDALAARLTELSNALAGVK